MTKKFTKLFSFKAMFAVLLLTGVNIALTAQCDPPVPAPDGALFSWQFDGGLEGWRSLDADGNDATVGFVWDAEGRVDRGAFNNGNGGTTSFVISPSVCNGAMVFDSDFYDNGGNGASAFGTGLCPVTTSTGAFAQFCDGFLQSPVIDLSVATGEVALRFNQGLRQFNSEYYVLLSKDGGLSYYDTLTLNADIPTNSAHLLNLQETIPLCGAAGSTEFMMTFWYRGNYYYWAIDDVAIVPSEDPDMRVNENFFSISHQFGTPSYALIDLPFLSDIENVSATEGIAPELTVSVRNPQGEVIHTDTRTYDNVPGCMTDENKPFLNLFTPPSDLGRYTVEYTISAEGDVNAANDTVRGFYDVTENEFQKVLSEEDFGGEYLDGIRYSGGPFQSWGSYFYVPESYNGTEVIDEINAGFVVGNGLTVDVGEIVVAVYQWIDVNGDGGVNSGDADEKIKLGEATYLVTPDNTDFRDFKIKPLDADGNEISLEAGAEYLVMLHHNPFSGVIKYFGLNSPAEDERSFYYGANQLAFEELEMPIRYASLGGVGTTHEDRDTDRDFFTENRWTFFINMKTAMGTGAQDINENLGVTVFPTPASTTIFADLALEELSKQVEVTLVNMQGSIVSKTIYSNIQNERLSVDVSEVPGGMYLLNIGTDAGIISKKVSVIH